MVSGQCPDYEGYEILGRQVALKISVPRQDYLEWEVDLGTH